MMGTVQSVQHSKAEESSRATVSPVVGGGGAGRGWVSAAREKLSTAAATPSTVATAQPQRPASSIGGMDLDDRVYPPPMVMAGQKRKLAEIARDTTSIASGVVGGASGDQAVRSETMLAPSQATSGGGATDYSDVVDRGILTMAQAGELFARYTDQMCPHLPGVVFTPGTTVAEVRKSKPTLFLSVMAAASSEIPDIQKTLTKELMQVLADKVMVVGEKSLELVQALQVAVVWYWPPEHFEELKFYQLVHVAAVMAVDLGLGRKKQARGGFRKHIPHSWRDHPLRKKFPPDPTTIEARRAWLTCYFLATNTSMALHRPNLIRWTPFMAECVDVLESSPEAAPTDKYLCHLVWTHKLAEEVGIQFSMDDPACTPNISDSRTQYALRGFERDLERYSSSIPPDMHQPSLKLSFHVLSLYMHEIATQNEFVEDSSSKQQPPQPCSIDSLKEALVSETPLTSAHINALSACLTAIDGIFDVFLSLNVTAIRCLPVFNFVRVAYAVVVLIKMYFAASSPKSELGKVINKDNMKVEQHLEALLEKFRATAADDRSRPASKFLVVLVMLRSWFQKQNQNGGPPAPGREGREECSAGIPAPTTTQTPQVPSTGPFVRKESMPPPLPPQQQQQNDYSSNTPLQLLSEIATKGSGGNGMGMTTPTPTGTNWNRVQPSYMWDTPTTTTADTPGTVTSGGGGGSTTGGAITDGGSGGGGQTHGQLDVGPPMPWLNNAFVTDFDYSSLGFAQAMDLTFANLTNPAGLSMENPGLYDIAMQQDPSMWFSAGGLGSTLEDMGASGLGTNFY
ncbi:hypothetical protein QBC46DRAFT_383586 [Diplogelasinospora grovesii]|uniref:Xylanolytic transcriptional activator regulatory domain-containing protein n=1 Tax=Diplogelasinospora grovesii TaxID=303347 RepID=A0AAN6NC62_9PEZI|nr:hypothetical protein QBC46DRAFT_383586 [Diplogelasinospora grovesii]